MISYYNMSFILKEILIFIIFKYSLEECHLSCDECYNIEYDVTNMQCKSCQPGLYLLYNTRNCFPASYYNDHYINRTDSVLYPCSLIPDTNCYECNPFNPNSETGGICLSCLPGYEYNRTTKECVKCKENEYAYIINDFNNCKRNPHEDFCSKYITTCKSSLEEISCPDELPFFNKLTNACEGIDCYEKGYQNGTCLVMNEKYLDRALFINWFKNEPKYIRYPSYNTDKSGNLLIELTCELEFDPISSSYGKKKFRKLYFYDKDGRGYFDPLNDEYERTINIRKKATRYFSTSIALKNKTTEEYDYLLNLEGMDYNLEFIDLKTFEITKENLFDVSAYYGYIPNSIYVPSILLLELNEKNQYLMSMYLEIIVSDYNRVLHLMLLVFNIDETNGEKIDVNSLNFSVSSYFGGDLNLESKYFIVQTKKGILVIDIIVQNFDLIIGSVNVFDSDFYFYRYPKVFKWAFHKLLFLKDEISLLCYYSASYSKHNVLTIRIIELEEDRSFTILLDFRITTEIDEGTFWWNSDMISFSENRTIFTVQKLHGRRISIYIIDFFDEYNYYIINKFLINTYNDIQNIGNRYALLFKYKEILGFQFESLEGENGFVLFGYYNSTDPKQILNLKTDGLNYNINLGDYLNLQTNIFKYEIKYIKIVEVPNIESGIYLISKETNNIIKTEDCVPINSEISLYFAYNGTLKKGNYLFKFAGVLQEPIFEKLKNYSDETFTNIGEDNLDNYTNIYNERRNLNITGKLALVQINILNDTKVFCDKKYDNTAIKSSDNNKLITCGNGKFYDVKNVDEITQLNLGINYHFVPDKDYYIKCHKRCKTCSKEYNDSNMNCDECQENYFLRDGFCLEISKCEYNYFYDKNYDLHCIDRENYCPDFKPDEDKVTKECIEKCNIIDYEDRCNPTNNLISINETYKQFFENNYLTNIEALLFKNKEKFTISGNNVSFIFTTSEKEKEELSNNYNTSSVLLGECENILKKEYSIGESTPLPILKIETLDNHSDYMDVYYEVFHPLNLSQKLDLDICDSKYVELRLPIVLKEYKLDLITNTKELGYNIFDLNDSFYHDICSVFTYNNSDISLSERKNLLDFSNEKLCIDGCSFSNIDIVTLRSICTCEIHKFNNSYEEDYTVDMNNNTSGDENLVDVLKKTIDVSNALNIKVVKCFEKIFTLKIFTENYGFYISFFMNLFNIIIIIFSPISKIEAQITKFCASILEQMKKVYQRIETNDQNAQHHNIINEINNYMNNNTNINNDLSSDKPNESENKNDLNDNENNQKNINIIINNKEEQENQNNGLILKIKNNEDKVNPKRRRIKNLTVKPRKKNANENSTLRRINSLEKVNNNLNINKANNDDPLEKEKAEKEEKMLEKLKKKNDSEYYVYYLIKNFRYKSRRFLLSESEIESLDYKYALKIDNRNNGDYYFSLLKEKNKIISIFLNKSDYNIQAVKVSLFLFNFNLSITVNALFFNDEAIHQVNQDQGSYNLNTQISIVIYSAIISTAIGSIVEYFALTHKKILDIRNKKDIKEIEDLIPELIKKLKLGYRIFSISTIVINLIFWYYITSFCAIYSIIQTHMISDSLMSFLLSISYSILLSLISSIIRVAALKKESKLRHFFYTVSWILSLI